MGFGWLLVGYFFASVISLYSPLSFAMLAGYPMMIMGLWMLAPYHRYLHIAFYASFFSLPFAIYYAIYGLGQMGADFPKHWFDGALWQTVEWGYFAFSLFFTVLLLSAIMLLCRELYLIKLQGNAMRNMLLMGVMYLLDFIGRLPISFIQSHRGYIAVPVLFLRLITIFLNIYLIYGCYRYICPEGEQFKGRGKRKNTGKEEGK